MKKLTILGLAALSTLVYGCDDAPVADRYGANPSLPEPQRGLLPNMTIADPTGWGNARPTVPQGFTITPIATDLKVPRQTLVLPNGDILIAEGKGGGASPLRPKDVIAGYIKAKGTTSVKGGDRLTLLRDANGDGVYEGRTVFAENLNAPYGLALANGKLYVANQDALVSFAYRDGQIRASGPPVTVTDLPSQINHHWTKSLAASPDGSKSIRRHRIEQQHHRTRHARGGRSRDGVGNRRRDGRAPSLRDRRSQPYRARDPARYRPVVGGGERA